MRIDEIFSFEKGVLQSSKCVPGDFDFITASSDWKTHNEYTHDCEALIFAAAASGSLGRTHYVNGKFVSSDLCFIITPKDQKNLPVDLKFYHILFNELKDEIVRNTKAGTSKEAIGLGVLENMNCPILILTLKLKSKIYS
jgi:type I restriction enzyme S subunit